MSRKKQPTTAELRKFGLVVSIALSVGGGFFVWRGREWAVWVYVPAGTLLLLGLVAPEALRQVERIWMIVADVLGAIMTRVILVLSFSS